MNINMILLMRHENTEDRVTFAPAKYDLAAKEGKVLETSEAGPFHEFVAAALKDMQHMVDDTTIMYAKQLHDSGPLTDEKVHDLYLRLLASFSERPMEMVGNMLASTIVDTIQELVEAEDFGELYDQWATAHKIS